MEDFGTLARIKVECYKQRLMCCSRRSFDDCSVDSNIDGGVLAQEVSERNSIINLARSYSYDILTKNMAFCPSPKHFPEDKLQSNGIIWGTVDISRQCNIESVTWSLIQLLMTICRSIMKKSKWFRKKYKLYSLRLERWFNH